MVYPAQRARLHQISALAIMKRDRFIVSEEASKHSYAYLQMIKEAKDYMALPAAHFQYGGMLLWTTTRFEEASLEMNMALELAQKRGDISLQARCLTYLMLVARRQQNTKLTTSLAQQSLDIALAHKLYDYIGAANAHFAWITWKKNDYIAVHEYGQQAFNAWQQISMRYGFEWILRLQLIAVALIEGDIVEAHAQARPLLDNAQQRMPPEIDAALEKADEAANRGDWDLVHSWLETAVKQAIEQKYL
jgi:hypothetical protein